MIITPVYQVSGKKEESDDVIFTYLLQFLPGIDPLCLNETPKLVITPKGGTAPGTPRVLKIVADRIDTGLAKSFGGGTPQITFNIDGDPTLPCVDVGLDPVTKAHVGEPGSPNWFQGIGEAPADWAKIIGKALADWAKDHGGVVGDWAEILSGVLADSSQYLGEIKTGADKAKPSFSPLEDGLNYQGDYPKARSGGDGAPGGKGGKGADGTDGPVLEIWTKQILGDGLIIDFRGQSGGNGGKGGDGQFGGDGQLGSMGVVGTDTTCAIPHLVCKQPPGVGGDGGRGGNAGCGGDGGDGGNGGVFKLFYTSSVDSAQLSKFNAMLTGGKGGSAGQSGTPGDGGKSGPPGINIIQCLPVLSSSDGSKGLGCNSYQEGGISQVGQDGKEGYTIKCSIKELPQVPGLPPLP